MSFQSEVELLLCLNDLFSALSSLIEPVSLPEVVPKFSASQSSLPQHPLFFKIIVHCHNSTLSHSLIIIYPDTILYAECYPVPALVYKGLAELNATLCLPSINVWQNSMLPYACLVYKGKAELNATLCLPSIKVWQNSMLPYACLVYKGMAELNATLCLPSL